MQDLDKLTIQTLKDLIDKIDRIVIIPHKNPDGDAIGSSLGLYHYLTGMGKQCSIVVNDPVPEFLLFLPKADHIMVFETNTVLCKQVIENAQLICCLDYSQLHRSGNVADSIQLAKAPKIMIDHHPEPEPGFQFYYHEIASSSTCELIFQFVRELDPEYSFSTEAATCLYTGLMTDTGCFRHALRPLTFLVAAELIRSGISYEYIVSRIFDSNTKERLKLIGFVLNDKMEVLDEYRTAYISLSYEESEQLGLVKGDSEGLVNYTLSIQNMVMGVFFHEREKGKVKISFRSKGNFAVNELSGKYFEGGGHKNAAGGEFQGTVEQAITRFKEVLPQYKTTLQSLEIGKRN